MNISASEGDDLVRLRRQDVNAFTTMVEEHQPVVLGLCRSMGLQGADAEDAAAEVFANVYRALPTFDGRAKLGTRVYRIAYRTILRVRAKRWSMSSDGLHQQVDQRSPSPEQALQTSELKQQVWDAVARLEPRQALVVELYYRRDWPLQEIAEAMDCPLGTVKTLLFRAREELKQVLPGENQL